VSFANVVTFNMDEYVGLARDHSESYYQFMKHNLFKHIDIKEDNINFLDGNTSNHFEECERYEAKIKEMGGIRLFLCGVGNDGHIAFNEPYSSLHSRTRLKYLTSDTIAANSRFFDNDITKVPTSCLTMGVATVTESDEIILLASGPSKAFAIQQAVEGSVNHMWTVSALQQHPKTHLMVDEGTLLELKWKTLKYFKETEAKILEQVAEDRSTNAMEKYDFNSYPDQGTRV